MVDEKIKRILQLKLPKGRSAFLLGARQTGKSTYLKSHFSSSFFFDFLKTDEFIKYSKFPHQFREAVLSLSEKYKSKPIIVDEVQKIPILLNEIHWLIENANAQFILCGSSSRKLKRGAANLLGGRAWKYNFYPFVYPELLQFNLLKALKRGLIPSHYLSEHYKKSLEAYVGEYLKEEIQEEGLVRNLPDFARFLDSAGFSQGEMVNYNNIARDCGVDAKTVKSYYQILVDTLIGYLIYPYFKKVKRDIISKTPKFYLFDVGVANYLSQREIVSLKGVEAGRAFEHYVLMELTAYKGLKEKRYEISYWRTKTGLEVDFILGRADVAIEVKLNSKVSPQELKGLAAFCEEHKPEKAYVVSQDQRSRKIQLDGKYDVTILPWKDFLEKLWAGKII